jgi:hypothetical protein
VDQNALMRFLRYISWCVAVLIAGLGLTAAVAVPPHDAIWPGTNARGLFVGVALVLAGIMLLLAHQRWSKYVGLSALLALDAFPALLVPYDRVGPCWSPHRPCMDRNTVEWHPGVRLAMFLVLLVAALITATIGFLRERGQRPASALT